MKKILLVLMVFMAFQVNAQYQKATQVSVAQIKEENNNRVSWQNRPTDRFVKKANSRMADRYYDFCNAVDKANGGIQLSYASGVLLSMWQDSSIVINYTSGPGSVNYSSAGNVFDPRGSLFNDKGLFPTEMEIDGNTNTYVIDSIFVLGQYRVTQPGLTNDKIRMSVVKIGEIAQYTFGQTENYQGIWSKYGTPSGTTDTAVYAFTPRADSVAKVAGRTAASRTIVDHNLTYADTSFDYIAFPLPTPINVSNGEPVAVSFTFFTGDTWIPNVDSISNNMGAKNSWRPVFWEEAQGQAITYRDDDRNQSSYMQAIYPTFYAPAMLIEAVNDATLRQENLDVIYHVTCTNCAPIATNDIDKAFESVSVYPNPATTNLNITLTEANTSDVNVTVYSMVGKKLASNVVAAGTTTVSVDIASLPLGIYLVELEINGQTQTQKITKK